MTGVVKYSYFYFYPIILSNFFCLFNSMFEVKMIILSKKKKKVKMIMIFLSQKNDYDITPLELDGTIQVVIWRVRKWIKTCDLTLITWLWVGLWNIHMLWLSLIIKSNNKFREISNYTDTINVLSCDYYRRID